MNDKRVPLLEDDSFDSKPDTTLVIPQNPGEWMSKYTYNLKVYLLESYNEYEGNFMNNFRFLT
jgi:hypothetical protein